MLTHVRRAFPLLSVLISSCVSLGLLLHLHPRDKWVLAGMALWTMINLIALVFTTGHYANLFYGRRSDRGSRSS